MRRFTLTMALAAVFAFGFQSALNAQGTRNITVLEIFTGTWCTYCPGSAMGADDMHANGHSVGIVEHHIGDSYETTETSARDGWYNVSGYPTSWFDGTNDIVGGNATTSIYPAFLTEYNQTIAVPTPYNFTMNWTQNGNNVDVTVTVDQVGTSSASNLAVHIVAIESHIPENWLAGLTEVNDVNRDMVPDQNGTSITVSQGNPATVNQTIAIQGGWVQNNMHVVAWVQDMTTKQIWNGGVLPLLPPTGQYDPEVVNINNTYDWSCMTSYTPEVMVKNLGSDDLTSLEFTYSVNGGTASTHTWTGTLSWGASANIPLPAINFTPINTNNQLDVSITQVNGGVTDVDLTNNDATTNWDYANSVGTYVFSLTTDNYGYETYWELVNSSQQVVASGGNTNVGANGGGQQTAGANDPGAYGNNQTITENITLNTNDCYTLRLLDDYSDGICCSYGNGSYSLTDPNSQVMVTGGTFGQEETTDWFADGVIAIDNRMDEEVAIYPNPSNGIFTVEMGSGFNSEATISVHELNGKEIFRTNTTAHSVRVSVSDLATGIYMVKVHSADGIAVKKLTIE